MAAFIGEGLRDAWFERVDLSRAEFRSVDLTDAVREVLDGLTDEVLDGQTQPVEGPGWPESCSYPETTPGDRSKAV